MAKSQNRQVDKVERGARLAQRQRRVEANEFRNMNRLGFREMESALDELQEEDDAWEAELAWQTGNAQAAH